MQNILCILYVMYNKILCSGVWFLSFFLNLFELVVKSWILMCKIIFKEKNEYSKIIYMN